MRRGRRTQLSRAAHRGNPKRQERPSYCPSLGFALLQLAYDVVVHLPEGGREGDDRSLLHQLMLREDRTVEEDYLLHFELLD